MKLRISVVAAALALGASAAAADPQPSGSGMAHTCAACHGTHGQLSGSAFVPLAGMSERDFTRAMKAFLSGERPGTLMGHVAQGFSDADIEAMAAFFARQTQE